MIEEIEGGRVQIVGMLEEIELPHPEQPEDGPAYVSLRTDDGKVAWCWFARFPDALVDETDTDAPVAFVVTAIEAPDEGDGAYEECALVSYTIDN